LRRGRGCGEREQPAGDERDDAAVSFSHRHAITCASLRRAYSAGRDARPSARLALKRGIGD
jgi:hypothetical protein